MNFKLPAFALSFFACCLLVCPGYSQNKSAVDEWNGFQKLSFQVADRNAYVVVPTTAAEGSPWVWRARFPNYHPEIDIQLLGKGFHIAYVDVAGMFGSPRAMEIGDAFYQHVTTEHKLAAKPALEGVSRGGLFVYNWAVRNPDKVACIYCDTPVCDIKSWPAGSGEGIGHAASWKACADAYEMTTDDALVFRGNPIDHAKEISQAKIPLMHIVSESDRVVPAKENTYLLQQRLKEFGHPLEIISVEKGTKKSNGHHFTHPDPNRVVGFLLHHAQEIPKRRELLQGSKRIVFLGDSITYSGDYVAIFDGWLQSLDLQEQPTIINVGLPSETVSGLSEEGHAGGRFPRPDLDERLDRVLAELKPDLVFACYGINCGIYQPFNEDRFAAYKAGINNLKEKVSAAGSQLILITPPSFDDQRAKKDFLYNDVLGKYADWLVSQREQGQNVIDLHRSMSQALVKRRKDTPEFTFQPDSVHPDQTGHWFIANELALWFVDAQASNSQLAEHSGIREILNHETQLMIRQRMILLRDAYLTETGHERPGIQTGLPVEQALEKAKRLTDAIAEALRQKPKPKSD